MAAHEHGDGTMEAADALRLLDWRRRIHDLYAEVRAIPDPGTAFDRWCAVRDELFRTHPCSPVPPDRRSAFAGLRHFEHDPAARVLGRVEPADPEHLEIAGSAGATFGFTRVGTVGFELGGRQLSLDVFWMDGYAGGLFLPFRDETAGTETYGAGRYLLDTVKGADLGHDGLELVLDFNLAYAPSCAYDPRWACPLAPPGNRLAVPIRAGERSPADG